MDDMIKLTCRGPNGVVEIELSDPDKAVAIARSLSGLQSTRIIAPRKPQLPSRLADRGKVIAIHDDGSIRNAVPRYKTALRFLESIRDAGNDGLTPEEVGKALGVSDLRGIGGRTAQINKVLKTIGHEHKYVYGNTRTAEGRTWKQKSRINDAIASLRIDLNLKDKEER